MEIYIPGFGPHLNEDEARLKLISGIASIAHHYPLHSGPEVPVINFEVRAQQPHFQRGQRGQRGPSKTLWFLTFPSISFGERFLDYLKNDNTRAAAFGPNLRFYPSTIRVGNNAARTPKVPHPELVHRLKTTAFKDPEAERAAAAEAKRSAGAIPLTALSFGRINQDQAFSSEYGWEFDDSTLLGNLLFDPESASLTITLLACDDDISRVLSIQFKHVLRIELDFRSIILFLSQPPLLTASHAPQDYIRLFTIMSNQPAKLRVSGFTEAQRLAMPFTGKTIQLAFANEHRSRIFEHRRTHYRLPKMIPRARPVIKGEMFSLDNLNLWQEFLGKSDIRVAFILELLLYNHHLDFDGVLEVSDRLATIQVEQAERALVNLVSQLGNTIDQASRFTSADQQNTSEPDHSNGDTSSLADKLEAALSTRHIRRHPLEDALEENGLIWCRSVTITPTGLILELPVLEESNSVLRRYAHPHYFIRVALRDEDGSSHRADRETDLRRFLRDRYLEFLTKGLHLAGRKFEFLGYSSSALKDHQAWFVCPFYFQGERITAEVIRDQMGDFSRVNRIPARYMARIAQAFTTTREALTLRPDQLELIPDVIRNRSVFTDGVGTISPALARRVETSISNSRSSRRLNNSNRSTCYQIRLGGFKGMLSIDTTLVGEIVRLRPSMDKFDAPGSLTLNIAATFRRPLNAFLNRPLIKVLEDLQVPPSVFLKLQRNAVLVIENSRTSFTRASTLLERHGLGEASGLPGLLNRLNNLEQVEIHVSGFIEECLDLAVVHCLKDLKYRARIPLPGSHTLVGVADEDQVLGPSEVYACVRAPGKSRIYVSGPIAIARSPCCHPGDVQLVTAIGRPPAHAVRLAGLTNCVVFSVHGSRSLPSCLGGGDLDGDIYTLITDPELIPPPSKIHRPANYDPPEMVKLDRPCTITDGAQFFLDYIASDLVGPIASRHLHIADASPVGSRDPDCLKLSQLHSDAVDYPKTGVPVNFLDLPKAPKSRPDFMSPEFLSSRQRFNNEQFYESDKVLGRLFRDIPVDALEEETMQSLRRQRKGDQRGRVGLDNDFSLTRAVEKMMIAELDWKEGEEMACIEAMRELAVAFGDEYWKICRLNTLGSGMGKASALSEPEAFMGVIAASSKDRREKRDTMARLVSQTGELFSMLKAEMIGKVDEGLEDWMGSLELNERFTRHDQEPKETRVEVVRRAWAAWKVACDKAVSEVDDGKGGQPKWFGIRSFGLVALDVVLTEMMD